MSVSTATKKLSDTVVNQINNACRLGRKSVLISLNNSERPHTFFFTGFDWPDTQAGVAGRVPTAIPQFGDYRTPGSTLGLPVCIVAYQQPTEHGKDLHGIIVEAEDIKHSTVHPPLFVFVDTACDSHLKLHCYLIPSDLLDIESVQNTKTPYQQNPDSAPSPLCLLKLNTRATIDELSVEELPNKLFEIYCSQSSSLKRGDSVRRPWRLGSLAPDGDYTCSIEDFLKAPIGLTEQNSEESEQDDGLRQISDGGRRQGILPATPKRNQNDKRLLTPNTIGSQERARGPKKQLLSSLRSDSSPAEPSDVLPKPSSTLPHAPSTLPDASSTRPTASVTLLVASPPAVSSEHLMNGTLQPQMSGGSASELDGAPPGRALQATSHPDTNASFRPNSRTNQTTPYYPIFTTSTKSGEGRQRDQTTFEKPRPSKKASKAKKAQSREASGTSQSITTFLTKGSRPVKPQENGTVPADGRQHSIASTDPKSARSRNPKPRKRPRLAPIPEQSSNASVSLAPSNDVPTATASSDHLHHVEDMTPRPSVRRTKYVDHAAHSSSPNDSHDLYLDMDARAKAPGTTLTPHRSDEKGTGQSIGTSTDGTRSSDPSEERPSNIVDAALIRALKQDFMATQSGMAALTLKLELLDLRDQLLEGVIPSRGLMTEILDLLTFMRENKQMKPFWEVFRELVGYEPEETTTKAFDEFLGEVSSFARRGLEDENGNVPPFQGPSAGRRRRAMERAERERAERERAERQAQEEVEKNEYEMRDV